MKFLLLVFLLAVPVKAEWTKLDDGRYYDGCNYWTQLGEGGAWSSTAMWCGGTKHPWGNEPIEKIEIVDSDSSIVITNVRLVGKPARRSPVEDADVLETESGYMLSIETGRHTELVPVTDKQAKKIFKKLSKRFGKKGGCDE